jgi:60 kDa SS-A/Ro ribonucleoprotein
MGAAAMAMVTARTGDPYAIYGFSTQFKNLGVTAKDSLSDAMRKTNEGNFGGTDCSLPMTWAQRNKKNFDSFFVYTDNETWAGNIHPSEALVKYRKAINPEARLAVIAMVANDFTIADPNDAGMLDVVGFDTATPQILSDFAQGVV